LIEDLEKKISDKDKLLLEIPKATPVPAFQPPSFISEPSKESEESQKTKE